MTAPVVRFSPGIFVWGHVFQRGDLPLFIRDPAGNPASPFKVTYTLFYYIKGLVTPVQVGPEGRTPVTADLGEYYVSAVGGEGGQTGDWYVRWTWQESFGSQEVELAFPFKIFDSSQFPEASSSCCSACGAVRTFCSCHGTTPRW